MVLPKGWRVDGPSRGLGRQHLKRKGEGGKEHMLSTIYAFSVRRLTSCVSFNTELQYSGVIISI
jgi:hypothetical protein